MRIGFIGLGRMGANMVRRGLRDEHEIVAYNRNPGEDARDRGRGRRGRVLHRRAGREAREAARGLGDGPGGDATEAQIEELLEHLEPGDTIIDGGNTNFHDDVRRHAALKEKGIDYVDAGTSGGIWGLKVGYCLMVGGEPEPVKPLEPFFKSARARGRLPPRRRPGRGHYVKMVHNGIEYGLMQAYAGGLRNHARERLRAGPRVDRRDVDARLVVRSWLLELAVRAFKSQGQDLQHLKGWVADIRARDAGPSRRPSTTTVPAPVITLSLLTRFRSRQDDSYGARVLAALRNEFGGHAVKTD
jgi:6-phosphogluconate dehydrogenase